MNSEKLEQQIISEQKNVDYNTREFTIEILVQKYIKDEDKDKNELYVPDYQREFVWDDVRQSKFIESIMLGLPIPLLFVAENEDGRLEIVDGSQRIRTLNAFIHDELKITGLDMLTEMNGLIFSEITQARARKFKNTPLRMIVLAEKTTEEVKNDIFDRINRGSDLLKDMEKRKGIFRGKFNDFIYNECAKDKDFIKITRINKFLEKRQEREELILRFFAFSDNYPTFRFSEGLTRYLDNYLDEQNKSWSEKEHDKKWKSFKAMVDFVDNYLPYHFSKNEKTGVSRVYFEALSVGIHLAITSGKPLITDQVKQVKINEIIDDPEFKSLISAKYNTHTPSKVSKRIMYIRDKFAS